MANIGNNIKAIREGKNLSQKEVTAKASLTASYLANLETNQIKKPALPKLKAIAAALDTPWEQLIKSTDGEALLIQTAKRLSKVWCGNRDCPSNPKAEGRYVYVGEEKYWQNGIRAFASFPAYDEDGERNLYCPTCGQGLISECSGCGRKIRSGENSHCTGCGRYLWPVCNDQRGAELQPEKQPELPDFLTGITDDEIPF